VTENFIVIDADKVMIRWTCWTHLIKGKALGLIPPNMKALKELEAKNFCPRCSQLENAEDRLEKAYEDGKIPKR